MIKSGLLIGTMAFSLVFAFAATAMASDAQNSRVHHYKRQANAAALHYSAFAYGDPNLPVENALRWGYSQGYSNYPSGFGGLYGDGRYPGNTVSNPHYNTLH